MNTITSQNKHYLLDASIIGHWLLDKDKLGKKIGVIINKFILGKLKLSITPLTVFEVGNLLRYSFTSEDLSTEMFREFLDLELPIVHISNEMLIYAAKMSHITKTTFYDSSYHAVALSMGFTFLTNDVQYFKKAHKLGNIELLNKRLNPWTEPEKKSQ